MPNRDPFTARRSLAIGGAVILAALAISPVWPLWSLPLAAIPISILVR